jgi:hypothetical protein
VFYLKSRLKSAFTIVQASSSALRLVKPFLMNLNMMCLLVSLAATMSGQFKMTGASALGEGSAGGFSGLEGGF